jgi:hypothetical protein
LEKIDKKISLCCGNYYATLQLEDGPIVLKEPDLAFLPNEQSISRMFRFKTHVDDLGV